MSADDDLEVQTQSYQTCLRPAHRARRPLSREELQLHADILTL